MTPKTDNVYRLPRAAAKPFGFYPSQILERPAPPRWLIDGLVLRGTVTLLAGDGKIGKSLLLQQFLSSAAMGLPCIGRHVEKCKSFGYFCEDTQDWLATRQFDINAALGVEMPDYEQNYSWESRAAADCILANFEYGKMQLTTGIADGWWRMLWAHVEEAGSELIGIDTARAVFAGNELNASQVTPFMRALQAEAINRNAAIILLVHPPKADKNGFAGSGAWLNSARHGISLRRPANYDEETDEPRFERVLQGIGANYSHGRSRDKITWRDGVFVADETEAPRNPVTSIDKTDLDWLVLAFMRRIVVNNGPIPADWAHPLSMPNRGKRRNKDGSRRELDNFPYNALYDCQDRLLARGLVVRVLLKGRCCIRPLDGKYRDEEPWAV